MAGRPTIHDVAKAAGVSVATVDRVLNGRTKVREETARKVSEAANLIGYHARNLIEQRLRADLPVVRMGFILQKEKQAFYQNFRRYIEEEALAAENFRVVPIVAFVTSQAPNEMAETMEGMIGKVDAIVAIAVNHPRVAEAVVRLKLNGVPVLSVLSDFAQGERVGYMGTNNLKVGRTAAWMLATAARKPQKIAMFVGGHRWHGHELRETGFRSFFREQAPQFQVLDTLVNLETRQLAMEATLDLLARHPDLCGIYLAGGGMEGTIQALRDEREPGDVALVVNELTPESRLGLSDGYVTMVIGTPMREICRRSIEQVGRLVTDPDATIQGQTFFDSVLSIAESI
ncbi:MAG TPA: LacI family DNA-binding transcriptional regulator [Paracoccaceae bacterium]|nr:LacI family DNA-binding transcriptional regulator [Paracoccaceae bacterium]